MEKFNYYILWKNNAGAVVRKAVDGYKIDENAAARKNGSTWIIDLYPAGVKLTTAGTRAAAVEKYENGIKERVNNLEPERVRALVKAYNSAPVEGEKIPEPEKKKETPNGTPEERAQQLFNKIARVPGLQPVIKGAKTARPIIWVTGTTTFKYRPFLKSQGGRWCPDKAAWYIAV